MTPTDQTMSAGESERERFETWFEQWRVSTWWTLRSEPKDQAVPKHWNINCKLDCERAWFARAALPAAAPAAQPVGWKLVPVEPTSEMIDAYVSSGLRFQSARSDWAAMLSAAPPAPAAQPVEPSDDARDAARLRSALWRVSRNFDSLLAGKPVRDVEETRAEVTAALSASKEPPHDH